MTHANDPAPRPPGQARWTWLVLAAVIGLAAASQGGGPLPGGRLAYIAADYAASDGYDIYIMDLEGGPDPEGGGITQITGLSADAEPDWSPDGERLIFATSRDGDAEIYIMDADGHDPVNLTNDPASDGGPVYSPACAGRGDDCVNWIAFHSDRAGSYDLYMMDEQGQHLTQLTDDPFNDDAWPSWSPDGERLAFTSTRDESGYFSIFVLDVTTGEIEQYTAAEGVDDLWPAWSPDGRQIAFTSSRGEGWFHIYTMDAGCRVPCDDALHQVTGDDPVHDFDPAWSPDGKWIAFAAFRDPDSPDGLGFDYELFAIRPNGSGLTQLTFNEYIDEFTPAWTR